MPVRFAHRLLLAALVAVATGAAAQGYRDDLPERPYGLLQAMIRQLTESGPTRQMAEPVRMLGPLLEALEAKNAAGLRKRLSAAIDKGDRGAAYSAVCVFVLLDAQDLLERVERSDFNGWQDAITQTRKAYLDFDLISPALHEKNGPRQGKTMEDFAKLAKALRSADLTTDTESIAELKNALVEDFLALRAAAEHAGEVLTKESK